MIISRDRILTTHVGSLPRSETLSDLLIRREAGERYDAAQFEAEMEKAVRHVVNKQKDAGIDIDKEKGSWYKSIGQGMGAALNMASSSNAYVLSDRGTWLSFKNKGDLQILVERDKRLFQIARGHSGSC